MAHESHASDSVAPYRIMGPEDTVHEEDARVCVDTLKAKIKKWCAPVLQNNRADWRTTALGPG